jgi:hypothetical protein
VILFDDIVQRSGETLREILSFVGADPSKAGTLQTDYNRKSDSRKLEMPDPIRNVLVEYLGEEVRVYSELLGGATRDAWPSLMAPQWSFKRRVLSFFSGEWNLARGQPGVYSPRLASREAHHTGF